MQLLMPMLGSHLYWGNGQHANKVDIITQVFVLIFNMGFAYFGYYYVYGGGFSMALFRDFTWTILFIVYNCVYGPALLSTLFLIGMPEWGRKTFLALSQWALVAPYGLNWGLILCFVFGAIAAWDFELEDVDVLGAWLEMALFASWHIVTLSL